MKFGLFYEHQLPKPYDNDQWDPDAEHKLLKNALDQIELAATPERRREALQWQSHLEDLLIKPGGVTGGR